MRRVPARLAVAATIAVLALSPAPTALADEPWLLTLDGEAAVPVDDPQSHWFGAGGSVGAGVYRPLTSWVMLGARARGGILQNANTPRETGYVDPGMGGFATLGVAARLRLWGRTGDPSRGTGPWLEIGGGAALTGDLVRAAFEGGVGWGFPIGALGFAPTVRYVQLLQPDDALDGRDARMVLFGLEVVLFDARREPPPPPPEPPGDRDYDGIIDPEDACPDDPEDFDQYEDEDGCPEPDNDQDGILDEDDQCVFEPEVVNGVEDQDGCPDEGLIEFVDDRIVLDDTVLFAYDRAYVRPQARPVLEAIIELWRQHPEWERVRIEGHTDIQGRARYNLRLSERRATNVMEALIDLGMPREMIESVGYGETRPLNRGTREATHQRNRRVEFVVISRRAVRPDGTVVDGEEVEQLQEDGAAAPEDAAEPEEEAP